jgi:hypothetical protein
MWMARKQREADEREPVTHPSGRELHGTPKHTGEMALGTSPDSAHQRRRGIMAVTQGG